VDDSIAAPGNGQSSAARNFSWGKTWKWFRGKQFPMTAVQWQKQRARPFMENHHVATKNAKNT